VRTRALFASVLLALGGLLALAPAAQAQENGDEPQLSEDTEECIHLAEEADDPAACQEAPSPIMPAADEFIWGSISFLVLLFLLWKFAYPSIKQGMEARTERIRADLASADDAKTEAQTVLDQYRAQLADAKAEAGRIIEEARAAADAVKRDHETRLQTELAEVRARAVADIESAKVQAMADLRGEVAQLAIGAAETVVGRNLDEATQVQLVEDYINQVAAQRA
jgi:F-type H+-transporting ATPase subunit b